MRGVWHHQDRRRRGPRELTGIVDHSRGGSSHGPLEWTWSRVGLAPCTRTGWPSATLDPFQGQQERHRLARSKTPPACAAPSISSSSPVTPQVRCAAASSKTHWATVDARGIPSIKSVISCAPVVIGSRSVNKNASVRPSRQMRHTISVEVAYHCAQQVREVFHQATPAQGRRLAARLVQCLPACPIPEIARLGADPTQVEGRTRRLLRHSRSQQRTAPKLSTQVIELGRRVARGYRNSTNYQLRMLFIAGGLDASTHTHP